MLHSCYGQHLKICFEMIITCNWITTNAWIPIEPSTSFFIHFYNLCSCWNFVWFKLNSHVCFGHLFNGYTPLGPCK